MPVNPLMLSKAHEYRVNQARREAAALATRTREAEERLRVADLGNRATRTFSRPADWPVTR